MTRLLVVALLALSAVARATDPAPAASPAGTVVPGIAPGFVDGATARRLVDAGVKVVDVRTPEEFAAGHVPGAVNIPYDQMAQRAGELGPPTTPVLLYCKSGRRSGLAAETLRQKGFRELYDLRSYDAWTAENPAR